MTSKRVVLTFSPEVEYYYASQSISEDSWKAFFGTLQEFLGRFKGGEVILLLPKDLKTLLPNIYGRSLLEFAKNATLKSNVLFESLEKCTSGQTKDLIPIAIRNFCEVVPNSNLSIHNVQSFKKKRSPVIITPRDSSELVKEKCDACIEDCPSKDQLKYNSVEFTSHAELQTNILPALIVSAAKIKKNKPLRLDEIKFFASVLSYIHGVHKDLFATTDKMFFSDSFINSLAKTQSNDSAFPYLCYSLFRCAAFPSIENINRDPTRLGQYKRWAIHWHNDCDCKIPYKDFYVYRCDVLETDQDGEYVIRGKKRAYFIIRGDEFHFFKYTEDHNETQDSIFSSLKNYIDTKNLKLR